MSHIPNVFSPAGTPLLQRTVGELVAERPGRSRIFQAAGIDFCCQGGRTLLEACERKNLSSASIVGQLEAELADRSEDSNPAELPPAELAEYIVTQHHGFLRRELPRLHAMSQRVAHVHGGHTPSLVEMHQVFVDMSEELVSHMLKEEELLFPAVVSLSRGTAGAGLKEPISQLMEEHAEVGGGLARLRELSHGFQPPAEACNTYRALFAGLHDLEQDLHRHIHLENAVLFPAAQALAAQKN